MQTICSIYSVLFHVKYALQYTFKCEKVKKFLGRAHPQTPPTGEGFSGVKPSPDHTPYEISIFAPPALMLGAFRLHPRNLAHGKVEVGGGIEPIRSFEIGGIDAPATTNRIIVFYASRAY